MGLLNRNRPRGTATPEPITPDPDAPPGKLEVPQQDVALGMVFGPGLPILVTSYGCWFWNKEDAKVYRIETMGELPVESAGLWSSQNTLDGAVKMAAQREYRRLLNSGKAA